MQAGKATLSRTQDHAKAERQAPSACGSPPCVSPPPRFRLRLSPPRQMQPPPQAPLWPRGFWPSASAARVRETWDSRLRQLIVSATETKRWALYDREPLERWTKGRITLLGDAAHAMLPFLAQGAAQATEDAAALADCLEPADEHSVEEALQRFEDLRRPRANRILIGSRGRGIRNHLPDGLEQRRRDEELAAGDPLRQSAWLYG